jgi:hypothetical protein
MPHRDDTPPDAQHSLTYSTTAWLSPHYMKWMHKQYTAGSRLTLTGWQSWFCQHLGIAPPALAPYAAQLCSCQRQPLDADHLHTCTKHSGNWHIGHEHLLSAVDVIAQLSGYRTARGRHVSHSRGQRRGDLEIKNLNVAGTANLIIDTSMVHDFHGSTADVNQHGDLRHHDPNRVLNDAAVKKIVGNGYRQDYLLNHDKAFLPLIMSTSGRLHGEFVRLLYLLAHRRALTFFMSLGHEPSSEELCQRRGFFFFQHRALIGLAGAQAVSLRVGGNAPSFTHHARPRQSPSHASSLDNAAGSFWMDVEDFHSQLAFV